MPTSKAKQEADARYKAKAVKRIALDLNKHTDADLLGWLEKQPSKQGAIKSAMRKQMEEEK